MKEEKISIYRVLPIVGMFLSIIIATIILFVINKKDLDEFLCVTFLIIGFVPIMVFELGYERRRGTIGNNTQTSYKRIFVYLVFTVRFLELSSQIRYFQNGKLVVIRKNNRLAFLYFCFDLFNDQFLCFYIRRHKLPPLSVFPPDIKNTLYRAA